MQIKIANEPGEGEGARWNKNKDEKIDDESRLEREKKMNFEKTWWWLYNYRVWLTSPWTKNAGVDIANIIAQAMQMATIAWFSVLHDIEEIGWTTAKYL